MFQATARSADALVNLPIVQVRGDHSDRYDATDALTVAYSELESLPSLVEQPWSRLGVPPSILGRLMVEARASDLLAGERPEEWSPLGSINRSRLGAIKSTSITAAQFSELWRLPAALLDFPIDMGSELGAGGGVVARLQTTDEGVLGAMYFFADAFVVPIPADADEVEVHWSLEPGRVFEARRSDEALSAAAPGLSTITMLSWRLYSGSNTLVEDGLTEESGPGAFRILVGKAQDVMFKAARILVGRVVRTAAKPAEPIRDPTAAHRMLNMTRGHSEAVEAVPDLRFVSGQTSTAVILIHGTMASAVPMAVHLVALGVTSARFIRFEHDTWIPIADNARGLVEHIRRLGMRDVLLIGHSRGGLVARDVARRLTEGGTTSVQVVTLGSPLQGTPWGVTPRLALMGVHTLLGLVRLTTGPMIDALTRLSGFMLLRREPPGLAAMATGSEYLKSFHGEEPAYISTVAGSISVDSHHDGFGIRLLAHAAQGVFEEDPNDLVVSVSSASTRSSVTAVCDHFSYFTDETAREHIFRAIERLPLPAGDLEKLAKPLADDGTLTW